MSVRMLGPLLYGAFFCIALPAVLVAWALRLDALLPVASVVPWHAGWWVAGAGMALVLAAMGALRVRGGGLPMNAYPPPRPVATGVYRLMAHPIYVGAALVAFGIALATGSPWGMWVVAPTCTLGAIVLVAGYEHADLVRRFGNAPGGELTRLPEATASPTTWRDIASVWLGLYIPFLVLFEAVGHLPVPDAFILGPAEQRWPVIAWTTVVYSLAYPFAAVAPAAFADARALRRWVLDARMGVFLGLLTFILVPGIAPPRPVDADASFAWLLNLERLDGLDGRAALPSFHTFWALHAARACSHRGRVMAVLAYALAVAIAITCVTTGMHASIDVLAGAGLAGLAALRAPLWRWLLQGAEYIANSWAEWRIGAVRVLSHSIYAGAAAGVAVLIVGWRLGPGGAAAVLALGIASLAGACVWGQYWTGSPALLRPFGYFGSVVALVVAIPLLAWALPGFFDGWALAGALAMAAPWVQGIGRLRCLVQGCCHGRDMPHGSPGIRYTHPRSRAVTIARKGGMHLHATPVYSMLANGVIGLLLLRFCALGAPAAMLVGAYLILAGMARFVEESFRGEPQTTTHAGLRLYQWCALASMAAGIAVMCTRSPPLPAPPLLTGAACAQIAVCAFAAALVHAFAMGVDFPNSNRRFARLADP